jgi:antitoxin VapB
MNRHEKPKQLNLKDDETYSLATELAAMHGDTLNDAVKSALREKLERDRRASTKDERLARLNSLIDKYASQIGPRTMTDDEAIGYDHNGLPT